jgi:5-methylthioadenosine/S-adenosylhomocysteine deaminase
MSESVDYIIEGDWVFLEPGNLIKNAGVVIGSGVVLEVGLQSELMEKYPDVKRMGGTDCLILPGFISTHTHLFQTFLKGVGQELNLRLWVQKVTSPASVALDPNDAYLSAVIGILDAIHSGTTSIFEYAYAFPNDQIFESILQAFLDMGVRGWLGIGVNDSGVEFGVHPDLILPLDQILTRVERLSTMIRKNGQGLVEPAIVTSSVRGLSGEGIRMISQFALDQKMIFSMHVNESPGDNDIAFQKFGKRLLPSLAEHDGLSDRFLPVHCVHMDQEDISLLSDHGVGVSHNPVSNMYLGSGISPIIKMKQAGIPISLGVDGAASNNGQDMLENLKFAVLGQRILQKDNNCMHASDAIGMATIEGAKVLHAENHLGKILPNYAADLTVLRFNSAKSTPVYDPVATTVFNSSPENVDSVLINGKIVLENRKSLQLDEQKIIQDAKSSARKLLARAEIGMRRTNDTNCDNHESRSNTTTNP